MLKRIYIFISKIFFGLVYDKKYLRGKYFDNNNVKGWIWCWRNFFLQKIIGFNKHVPWPVHPSSVVGHAKNISFDPNDLNIFQQVGCYYQCWRGKIVIGKGTWIAQNVGLITENHDVADLEKHMPAKDIIIGQKCWIGMNVVIMPGIVLGDGVIVGAGAIVTKSFPEGYVVIAGNPAKIIRKIEPNESNH